MTHHGIRGAIDTIAPRRLLQCAILALSIVGCSAGASGSGGTRHESNTRAAAVREGWVAGIDSLRAALLRLDTAATTPASTDELRKRFADARLAFKHIELAAAYYEPSTTKLMNGAALPRVEHEEGPEAVFPPEGFQVLEELLFPAVHSSQLSRVSRETGNLLALTSRLHNATASQTPSDSRVWDAARLEVARVSTLGIAGLDSPIAERSIPEAAAALRGVRIALAPYMADLKAESPGAAANIASTFDGAIAALDASADFASFDRFTFLVRWANPLARAIDDARRALAIDLPAEVRVFSAGSKTVFDSNAFVSQAFASPYADRDTRERAALGRTLFAETALSGSGTRSCASCHQPSLGFTDGRARSAPIGAGATLRNAPTMINAGLQAGSFADLRTTYLEDQVSEVVRNRDEMHGSVDDAALRLSRDSVYVNAFARAFAARRDSAVTGARIRSAIAAYVRSLVALNAPFDRAIRGDTNAIGAEARSGFNVFMGKAKCGTCHFAPLFNGTVPPTYQEAEVEVLGVPATPVIRGARIDPDSGRFRVTRAEPHLFAFKTPTLRNVALTAPYMHNGVFATLEQVVDFYDRGGGAGIGIALPNQTLPAMPLRLTEQEKRSLVAFMRTLTDTTEPASLHTRAPRWSP